MDSLEFLRLLLRLTDDDRVKYIQTKFTDRHFLLADHDDFLKQRALYEGRMSRDCFGSAFDPTNTPRLPKNLKADIIPRNQVDIQALVQAKGEPLYGKFFLCRTIAPPTKLVALLTVVEDPAGIHAVRLALYNFGPRITENVTLEMARQVLPPGTILIIKNPWFRPTTDEGLSIRSATPTDVIVLDTEKLNSILPGVIWNGTIDPKYVNGAYKAVQGPDSSNYKKQGNILCVAGKYNEAIKMYTLGIKSASDEDRLELFVNRSLTYQKQEKYELALADSEAALQLNPNDLRAHHCKVENLWGLKEFRKALKFVSGKTVPCSQTRTTTKKEKKEIKALLAAAERNVRQYYFGEYDMEDLVMKVAWKFEEKLGEPLDLMHWAEHNGPFQITTKAASGRGVCATRDIQPGELIMVSRAFSIAFKTDDTSTTDSNSKLDASTLEAVFDRHLTIDVPEKVTYSGLDENAISQMIEKLNNNPDKLKELYTLFAGPMMGYLNPATDKCDIIDLTRIRQIFRYNAFSHAEAQIPSSRILDRSPSTAGIWIQPSFINHSCVDSNVAWKIYGDFIFLRAHTHIGCGHQIFISYTEPTASLEERTQMFEKRDFKCQCRLCELERLDTEAIRKKRQKAVESVRCISLVDSAELEKKCLASIKTLRSTRPGGSRVNPSLLHPLFLISTYYFYERKYAQAIAALDELYRITKEIGLVEDAVSHVANIIGCMCKAEENKKKIKPWIRRWRDAAIAAYGSDDILKVRYATVVSQVEACGLYVFPC